MKEQDYFVPFEPYGEGSFEEKRSKFAGRIWRVERAEEAVAHIKQMREEYWDATHHCWAYIIREENLIRYSDDGEPQGTAGLPILDVLQHKNLKNVCCVVTRYFGGILLGTGGLVRAYTKGAQLALEAVGIMRMSMYTIMLIVCPYHLFEMVQRLLPQHNCTITDTDYGADVTLTVMLPLGGEDALNQTLANATAGSVYAEAIEQKFMGRQETFDGL